MREVGYTVDGSEVYVDLSESGAVEDVYGYADQGPAARLGGAWRPGLNEMFLHAVDPVAAAAALLAGRYTPSPADCEGPALSLWDTDYPDAGPLGECPRCASPFRTCQGATVDMIAWGCDGCGDYYAMTRDRDAALAPVWRALTGVDATGTPGTAGLDRRR